MNWFCLFANCHKRSNGFSFFAADLNPTRMRFALALSFLFILNQISAQLNMELIGNFEYEFNTNDVWGYVDSDSGDEYALVGTRRGLSIVDINQDTLKELFFLDGSNSTWRDIKTWGTFAYVSTEAADGLQVVDLTHLPDSVSSYFWEPEIDTIQTLRRIHNIFIDEFGILYICGSNVNDGGVIMADVSTDPSTPVITGFGPNIYSHDVYARDSIMYSSEVYAGTLSIYDITDFDSIELKGRVTTPFEFTHNAWLSDDSQFIFTTDERGNAPVTSYDISDPSDIIELDRWVPAETKDQGVVPHNVHVWNDWLVISYYDDGGKIVDASRPDNLIEVGNFDTFLPGDEGFGAWGAYPYLPSEKVLITDSGTGLYVLEPTYVRGAYLEGKVQGRDIENGGMAVTTDLVNAQIAIISDEIVTPELSQGGGLYKTGKAIPGRFEVEISADGYVTWKDSVDFVNGQITELNVVLEALTTSVENSPEILAEVEIAPNPVSDQLRIDFSDLDQNVNQITITNLMGQVVFNTDRISGNQQLIDTQNWPGQIYLVNIQTDQGQTGVFKIIVAR